MSRENPEKLVPFCMNSTVASFSDALICVTSTATYAAPHIQDFASPERDRTPTQLELEAEFDERYERGEVTDKEAGEAYGPCWNAKMNPRNKPQRVADVLKFSRYGLSDVKDE